jgi:rhodanese-related sulfurtransferase
MGLRGLLKRKVKGFLAREGESVAKSVPPPPVAHGEEEVEEEVPEIEVDDAELALWLEGGRKTVLLDIREPGETRGGFAKGALLIPMNSVPARLKELPEKDVCLLVYCAAGARSFGVTHWLREQGWSDSWSVSGGFAAVLGAGAELERD